MAGFLGLINTEWWDKICFKNFNLQHFIFGISKNTLFGDAN